MGYHQLLTIILGTIVTAVGVTMGISMFEEDAKKFQKDAASTVMLDVAGQVVAWSNRPASMGGGTDSYGSTDFSDITLQKLGYDHAELEDGALLLPDGSCITGRPMSEGKSYRLEWRPTGSCEGTEEIVLQLEISGPSLDHITMTEGDYASVWRDS